MIDQIPGTTDERLRRVLAVTDGRLSHLDADALFRELLERLRNVVGTDTAAILLLDPDAQQLVTVATIGLEDEVRHGYRVDVGAGFAGRIAQTREPLIIDDVLGHEVMSPTIQRLGIRTLVGVPMMAADEVVGVLHLGTFQPRRFSEEDVALVQLVADRAATANQTQQDRADRAATLAIQRSLLPTRLPEIEGVDLAARYLPGHQFGVGGDWYDVFRLPSGHLGVVVGDVSGHGLRAAVIMGRLRSALRAYALDSEDPADVLTRLDRKILHFEAGNLATILYAMVNPERDVMTISAAGHLPPIVACPGGTAQPLWLPVDLPVGVGHAPPRRTTTVPLAPGAVVVFYTDGLVERRYEVIDEGLRRLCAVVQADDAETVCSTVVSQMDVGAARDDIALLAVHRTG